MGRFPAHILDRGTLRFYNFFKLLLAESPSSKGPENSKAPFFTESPESMRHYRIWVAAFIWLGMTAFVYGESPGDVKSKLELARENLRISRATEARIAADLDKLKESGNASPEVLADYEAYLARVRDMVAVNQSMVEEMEAAYAKHAGSERSVNSGKSSGVQDVPPVELPEEEAFDELAPLDRELDESLAAFDEMLLRELDEIRAKSADKMTDLATEAAAAARRLREKGVEVATSPSEETAEAEESDSGREEAASGIETEKAEEAQEGRKEGTEERDMASRGSAQEGAERGTEPDHSDGYDDDIVARQIREAAERETDPELKAKLWKEYEDYKRGSAQ